MGVNGCGCGCGWGGGMGMGGGVGEWVWEWGGGGLLALILGSWGGPKKRSYTNAGN